MLNVFITVDNEVWPLSGQWRRSLRPDIDRDIYGTTESGEFGVRYQMDVLDRHGLKAGFFVEFLFALAAGPDVLRALVHAIQARGHEVQLHLHTEWLQWLDPSPLPGRHGPDIKDFTLDEQTHLVGLGLATLRSCGATDICAFRAGNYGANRATLHALAPQAVRYHSSDAACDATSHDILETPALLVQLTVIHGVHEFPISFFVDWPGHYRHAQLCACSAGEIERALLWTWQELWYSFVLVLHSFEFVRRQDPTRPTRPDPTVIRRFDRLCAFLAGNRDKFTTRGFHEIDRGSIPPATNPRLFQSALHRTARRFGEQVLKRI